MSRQIQDVTYSASKAMPAAGANNSTDAFDLGVDPSSDPRISPPIVDLQVVVPDLPALADAKNATFTIQDSADNAAFATVGISFTLTGAGGAGASGVTKKFRLPPNCRRYIRLNQAVDAAGGDSTGVSTTTKLLF